jgi:hypothetical protein
MGRTGKTVGIVQSSYIPWKGYFDLLRHTDEFILLDDVQFTKRDWRSRNRIKTPQGPLWLTIPSRVKGRYLQLIHETEISDPHWNKRHWLTLCAHYGRAPFFGAYKDALEELFLGCTTTSLSQVNHRLTLGLCRLLGIDTKVSWSMDYGGTGSKTERLVALCRSAGATQYLSGPTARCYLDERAFAAAGIPVTYFDYTGYPEYPQLYPPFDHHVSVIDLLVHTGPEALRFLERQP